MKEQSIFYEVRVAVHTEFATFLPRGRARPPPRAGMDRLDAEADVDSIPTHADLPDREALAALRPAPGPGGLIAIDPDLDPIRPDRRFEPLLENRVV